MADQDDAYYSTNLEQQQARSDAMRAAVDRVAALTAECDRMREALESIAGDDWEGPLRDLARAALHPAPEREDKT